MAAQVSSARPPLLLNDARALSALAALPPGFDREVAAAAWTECGIARDEAGPLWDAFEEAGLFTQDGEPSWWDELGWRDARAYHQATRDYPFLQMDEPGAFAADNGRMVTYTDEGAPPSPYQRLGGEPIVKLPGLGDEEGPDEWLERLSPEARRGKEGLGLLLDVCFGRRGEITIAGGSRCLLKSIPSGGARHPTEVLLGVFDVDGVEPAVYHYNLKEHALETVRQGQQRGRFEDATLDLFSRPGTPPAAVLVFTSRVARAMWRYRDPRSFRAVYVDVGHALVAYRYVARALGYRTLTYQKTHDRQVAELVGVDPLLQPPVGVGTLVP